nr:hypothetical protein [Lachnospiraceae bacterium]
MDLNKGIINRILSIAALVVLGYIFFISVYNQIIMQSGGFFYVIIFGGILILVFVLLSLITKLIEISDDVKDNFMWDVVEILILLFGGYLFLVFRLSYKSSVPAEETIIYRAASLIKDGTFKSLGMDMFDHLIIYPSQYIYARLLAVFFSFTKTGTSAFVGLNALVILLNSFTVDRIVRKVAGRACGIIAALCTLFIPSQSFAVYSYSSEFFFCLILLMTLNMLLTVTDGNKREKKLMIFMDTVFGFLLGLLLFCEPLSIFVILSFLIFFGYKRRVKNHFPVSALLVIGGVMLFFVLIFNVFKASSMGKGFGEVVGGELSRFSVSKIVDSDEKYSLSEVFEKFHYNLDNKNSNVNDNYRFLENEEGEAYTVSNNAWFGLSTQMSYMFILVMAIACSYYMFRNRHNEVFSCMLLLLGSFIMLFFRSTKENSTYFLFEVLIIIGNIGLYYMYLNHHSDISVLLKDEEEGISNTITDAFLAHAKALIYVNNKPVMSVKNNIAAKEAALDNTNTELQKPTEEYPEEYSEPTEEYPEEFSEPTEEYPEEYSEPIEEYPEEYSEPIEEYPEEYSEPTEEYPEEFSEPMEDYPEEFSEPMEEYPEEFSEPIEEYPEEFSEPMEEYPEEFSEPIEEYPEEFSEPAEFIEEYDEQTEEYP